MEKVCKTCVHFQRHYVKGKVRYTATGAGHCVYPRIKLRWMDTPACQNYEEKPES